jgi:type I restriction enzyme S subunit
MFGDPATNSKGLNVVALGDVLASADYGSSSKASDADVGLPMIRMGNVDYSGNVDLADLKYVELPPDEIVRFGLKDGDILFNRTNSKELVGKTGLWIGDREAILASYFIRLRVSERLARPFFVWAFMNTPQMKRVLFATARGAIGQANINSRELRAFRIPLPFLDEQARFELRCRDVLALRSQQRHATAKAEGAFQALLARAFSVSSQGAVGHAREEATA